MVEVEDSSEIDDTIIDQELERMEESMKIKAQREMQE